MEGRNNKGGIRKKGEWEARKGGIGGKGGMKMGEREWTIWALCMAKS